VVAWHRRFAAARRRFDFMAEFVLKVHDIDDRGKDYEFPLTAGWLDSALSETPLRRNPAAPEGSFHLHAQRNGQEILVRGQLQAELLVECSRCLGDTALHVHAPLTALLSSGPDDADPEDVELSEEDLDRARFVGNEVILDELVREHLVLEAPMQPLCSEECPGIPIPDHVRPPTDDFDGGALDPRLAPLQQLRGKLSGNKE
jgi:uncharacterized protein